MTLLVVSIMITALGLFSSVFFFKNKKEEKLSSVVITIGCIGMFAVFTNMILINIIKPTEIMETSFELVQFESGSYIESEGNDFYVNAKTTKDETESLRLIKNTKVIDDNDNPPFIKIKENKYPRWYELVFMKSMYPKEYEIHI
jgi:hypothetical protein